MCQDRTSDKLVDFLSDRRDKIEVAGIFSDDMHHLTSYPVIGRVRDLEGYVQEHKVDAVFTQIPERTSPFVSRLYRSIRRKYIQLHFVHDSGFERERIPLMGGDSSGLFIESNTQRPAFMTRHLVKRGGDIALSLFGILFLLSWLIPMVGVVSWFVRGKGPIRMKPRIGRFGRQFNAFARVVYDLTEKNALDRFAGLEFKACCWRLRLVGRRYVSTRTGSRDTGIYLQLELNGLASVGSPADAFLEQAIRGYSRGASR